MIFDNGKNALRYVGLGKHYETAFRYLVRALEAQPEPGHYEIYGEDVFANVFDSVIAGSNPKWEVHGNYTDIQCILQGQEVIGSAPTEEGGSLLEALDPARDIGFYTDVPGAQLCLNAGDFAVLFAGEPHSPGNPGPDTRRSKKLVIKVRDPRKK